MRRFLSIFLITAILFSTAHVALATGLWTKTSEYNGVTKTGGKNLIADGDMEASGTDDWTPNTGDTVLSKESGAKTDGLQYLRIKNTNASARNAYARQAILTAGVRYRVTGWARGDAGTKPRVFLGTVSPEVFQGETDGEWTRVDVIGTADNANFTIGGSSVASGSYMEFDDIFVIEYTGVTKTGDKQLLTDGDMEAADTSAWLPSDGSSTLSKEAGAKTDGSNILRLTNTHGSIHTIYTYQSILTAGNRYRVTGWARLKPGEKNAPSVRFGSTQVWLGIGSTTEWQRIDAVGVANSTSFRLWFGTSFDNTDSYIEWDDIVVTQID